MYFKAVFTAIIFDRSKDYVIETQEFETYEEAQNEGTKQVANNPEVHYFSVEKYYKKVVTVQ